MTACYLTRDGLVLELLHFAADGAVAPYRERAMNEPGLTHISVSVDDIPATCERVRDLGGTVLDDTDIGAAIFVRDPDGQLIELLPMSYREHLDAAGNALGTRRAWTPLHSTTLADVLREHRRSRPQRLAVVDGDVRRTFPELDERVNRLAHALAAEGVGSGDRVLWLGQNSARIIELLLAAAKLGAMCCPANWRQTADELAFVVEDLEPEVIVWQDEEVGETVRAARGSARIERTLAAARRARRPPTGTRTRRSWPPASPDDDFGDVDPDASLLLIYTAAFGGRPNAAMLSHRACIEQGIVYGHFTGTTGDDVYLNSGPMFHLGTLMHTLATFVFGGTNVFVPRVEGELLCRVIEAERMHGRVPRRPDLRADPRGRRRPALRPHDACARRTGAKEWNERTSRDTSPWASAPGGYGQSEVVGMMTYSCLALGATGTHGRTSPLLQIRVVDPDGNDVPDGEPGEIVARGPDRHERVLEPPRAQRRALARRLAPHERPRAA